jgi:hypothetical protein
MLMTLAATQVGAQDKDVETVPTALYSFLPEADAERQFIDLGQLSEEISDDYTIDDAYNLEATTLEELQALRSHPLIQSLNGEISQHIGEGFLQGGVSTGAAIVMLSVSAIAKKKCKALNVNPNDDFVVYKDAMLGRSTLRAVQYSIDDATQVGLGRGQFDIYTTKFAICRNQVNNDIAGIPINVRWVFNVNGNSLITKKGNLSGPNGKPYKQNFHAEGLGIQVVLMEIDGQALPPNHPVYLIVPNACIDIWLPEVTNTFDVDFPVSIPTAGVFCAGGYCKNVPPGLDATQ